MKQSIQTISLLTAIIWLVTRCVAGDIESNSSSKPKLIPYLGTNHFKNVVVLVDPESPKQCPPELANRLSNTNLFTFAEQQRIVELQALYHDVTTNSLPHGAQFKDWLSRKYVLNGSPTRFGRWDPSTRIIDLQVARFGYTNSDSIEEMASLFPGQITTRFRNKSHDGYDIVFAFNRLQKFVEYKNGEMDGLFAMFLQDYHGPDKNRKTNEAVLRWARFYKGKMVGKFLCWDANGLISSHVEFSEPFDFMLHSTNRLHLSWE